MPRRRGFTLIEVVAAAAVLGGLTTRLREVLRLRGREQQAMRDRSRATQLAANVMERLAAQPWDRLTPEGVRPLQDAADLRQLLPDCKIEIEIVQPAGEPDAKQLTIVVHRPTPPGAADRLARLVAWRYRNEAGRSRPGETANNGT